MLCEIYPLKKQRLQRDERPFGSRSSDAYEFQDYIDAQIGGPGKGFYRIVKNPFEARKVINDGKLAVILGMEVSEPFDCCIRTTCRRATEQTIDASSTSSTTKGLRQFEMVNKFDNALTGVAGDGGTTGVARQLRQLLRDRQLLPDGDLRRPPRSHDHTPTTIRRGQPQRRRPSAP